jgi:hypothetical protein
VHSILEVIDQFVGDLRELGEADVRFIRLYDLHDQNRLGLCQCGRGNVLFAILARKTMSKSTFLSILDQMEDVVVSCMKSEELPFAWEKVWKKQSHVLLRMHHLLVFDGCINVCNLQSSTLFAVDKKTKAEDVRNDLNVYGDGGPPSSDSDKSPLPLPKRIDDSAGNGEEQMNNVADRDKRGGEALLPPPPPPPPLPWKPSIAETVQAKLRRRQPVVSVVDEVETSKGERDAAAATATTAAVTGDEHMRVEIQESWQDGLSVEGVVRVVGRVKGKPIDLCLRLAAVTHLQSHWKDRHGDSGDSGSEEDGDRLQREEDGALLWRRVDQSLHSARYQVTGSAQLESLCPLKGMTKWRRMPSIGMDGMIQIACRAPVRNLVLRLTHLPPGTLNVKSKPACEWNDEAKVATWSMDACSPAAGLQRFSIRLQHATLPDDIALPLIVVSFQAEETPNKSCCGLECAWSHSKAPCPVTFLAAPSLIPLASSWVSG